MNIVDVCIEVIEICWKNGIEVKVGDEKIVNVKMFMKVAGLNSLREKILKYRCGGLVEGLCNFFNR